MFSANSSQVSGDRLYVEDVFSTYLYTGNDSTLEINNGIDLAGKGGLVWIKTRSLAKPNRLWDTARGLNSLSSNTTGAQIANLTDRDLTSFNSNGFSLGMDYYDANPPSPMSSWTFRKAPKFFDVVTYTGNGASNRSIAHNLGVAPGMITVKETSSTGAWIVYHRSLALNGGFPNYLILSATSAADGGGAGVWASVPTSTTFSVGSDNSMNENGQTYVAYLWAHDATADGIIQCGSFTAGSSDVNVTLGWEPQWLLVKRTNNTSNWRIHDTMRGMSQTGVQLLEADSSSAEGSFTSPWYVPTATGFTNKSGFWTAGDTLVYIAIRRGPMRTPTSGTSVFAPVARTGTGAVASITSPGFAPDLTIIRERNTAGTEPGFYDKLRGVTKVLRSNLTNAEYTNSSTQEVTAFTNLGFNLAASSQYVSTNDSGYSYINYVLKRAPSFFDVVCYTGNDVAGRTINHNLGVVPEMIIVKGRIDGSWWVQHSSLGPTKYLVLNTSDASGTASSLWNNTAPTSSVFTIGNLSTINFPGYTYVAYLFASCPGVSKIGTYTGNGSSQTINCGFAAGARFVMIKRTDSTGSWWVWDTARGLVSGNDPALQLNSTAAETTGIDSIDPDSSGFIVNQDATTSINASGGTYLFFAVA